MATVMWDNWSTGFQAKREEGADGKSRDDEVGIWVRFSYFTQ